MEELRQDPADLIANRARTLMRQGYRRVSNKYLQLARIDRPDWKERLAKHMGWKVSAINAMIEEGNGGWHDYYRRVFSKDVIIVSREVFKLVETSGFDPIGYIILKRDGI